MTPETLPRDPTLDATLALRKEGYRFIPDRCARLETDAFRTRLMGRDVICMTGPRGVRLLYGAEGMTRQGALPPKVLRLLQDKGSVQQMEGAAHQHRKSLFVRLLVEEDAADMLARAFATTWTRQLVESGDTRVLNSASDALAKVACEWAGFGPDVCEDARLRDTLYQMSARAGSVGPGVVAALFRRRGVERQLARALDDLPEGCLARRVMAFRENGQAIPTEVAIVEILNLLRPIVAVGRYIAFAARVLALEPDWRRTLATADTAQIDYFCEEVRRSSPFFPMTGGITTQPVSHEGLDLPEGQWVLADLWGTLQSEQAFSTPDVFRPDRALSWRTASPSFVPQGGGDVATTHRCPGERVTVALMIAAMQVLCSALRWDLPPQDLGISLNDMPTAPASGVLLTNIRAAASSGP
ncbi:cytochrome P450 [Pseudooceanicola algae]|uniref:Fatty-acid peroxygenase n=1 Tax=Pseudooceanicola algae TaxID=1537215 RepID=A0A418SBJ6_9RHOB|nr:cytochrome P450 [Pseudooceanicola algae]QPM92493.1 Fatty-acid peroxygenase [Pseudooceanicola algae]